MATVVNARDTLLQASASRYAAVPVPSVSVDYSAVSGTKPPTNADNTTNAFVSGVTIGSGGLVMSGGALRSSGANYTLQNGFIGSGYVFTFLNNVPVFAIGNAAGQHIRWDGSTLRLNANLDFSYVQNGPPANADNTGSAFTTALTLSGSITLGNWGYIRGGAGWYEQGVGFFLGWDTSAYKFFIGDASRTDGPRLTWNGTKLELKGDTDIDVKGLARFGGATTTPYGTAAVQANYLKNAQGGIVAWAGQNGGGVGLYAVGGAYGSGIWADGIVGGSFNGSSTGAGVLAQNTNGGVAMQLDGWVKSNSFALASGLNVEFWNGVKLLALQSGAGVATFNSSNKPGGASTNTWLPFYHQETGLTYYLPIWT